MGPQTIDAVLRLRASPDFALVMTWLDENRNTSMRVAIQPDQDRDRHQSGQAYALSQVVAKIRYVWEQKPAAD
jgi:hypothetical protein